jgi:hypothetical protein
MSSQDKELKFMILRTQKLNRGQSQRVRVSGHRSMGRVKMLLRVVCGTQCRCLKGEQAAEAKEDEAEAVIEAAAEVVVEAVVVAVAKRLRRNTHSEVGKVTF